MKTTHYITTFFSANKIRNSYAVRCGQKIIVKSCKTKEYISWINESHIIDNKKHTGDVRVNIIIYFKDKRKRDLDNFLKPCFDLLTKKGVYKDDSNINEINIKKLYDGSFNGYCAKIEIFDI